MSNTTKSTHVQVIYVFDDDPDISSAISDHLNTSYLVFAYTSLKNIPDRQPHLIILDVHLNDEDALSNYRFIKNKYLDVPVMFLSGESDVARISQCLNEGAEDYLLKPFDGRELLARVNRWILPWREKPSYFSHHLFELDPEENIVKTSDLHIPLTRTEANILKIFMYQADKIVTKKTLIDSIWPLVKLKEAIFIRISTA